MKTKTPKPMKPVTVKRQTSELTVGAGRRNIWIEAVDEQDPFDPERIVLDGLTPAQARRLGQALLKAADLRSGK